MCSLGRGLESERPLPLQEGMFQLGGKSYILAEGRVVKRAEIPVSHAPLRGVHQLCCCAVMELIALLRLKQMSPPNIQTHSCLVLHFFETYSAVPLNRSPSNSLYLWDVLFFPHGLSENSTVEEFWQKLIRSLDLLATLSLKSLPSRWVLVGPSHFAVYTSVNLFIFFPSSPLSATCHSNRGKHQTFPTFNFSVHPLAIGGNSRKHSI